jgi:hypothetical protein
VRRTGGDELMNKAHLRGLGFAAVCLLFALSLTSCWNPFAPPGGDDPNPRPPAQYKVRTSPENVIYNLHTAYEYMNATEYLDCLAEDYVFFLNPDDVDHDPEHPLPDYWDKNEERTIHQNMFGQGTDVEGITLAFTHQSDTFNEGDQEDPLDDMWTYIESVDLRVQLPPDLTLIADAPGEFDFQIDPNEVGPDGEILWEISRQWDRDNPGGSRGQDGSDGRISLSRLKAMYRE